MTREDVLAMPAGRELDALVAEHVMGWKWYRSTVTGKRAIYADDWRPTWMAHVADGTEALAVSWDCCVLPHSTDIAAAWMVVEKLAGGDWWPLLDFCHDDDHATPMPNCGFTKPGLHGWCGCEHGNPATMPEAISKAALFATLESA